MAATCFHKTLLWSLLNSLLFFLFSRKVAANHGTADLPVLAVSDCLALFPCLPRSSGPATARLRGCCWPAPQSSQEGQALWLSTESSPNLLITLGQKIQWQQRTRSYNTQSGALQKVIPESSSSPTGGNSLFPACPQARFLWIHKGWNCSFFSDTLEGAQYGRFQVFVQSTSSFIRLQLNMALLPEPSQRRLPGMWHLPSHRASCTYLWSSFQRSEVI